MVMHETSTNPQELITIPTDREGLILRQLTLEDAPVYFESYNASRPEIAEYDGAAWTNYRTIKKVEESIARPDNPDKLRMGIWDGETFVGSINMTPMGTEAEIGYWLDTRKTGNGYATDAAKAISEYAAARFPVVFAVVAERNQSSANVLVRSGFNETMRKTGKVLFQLADK